MAQTHSRQMRQSWQAEERSWMVNGENTSTDRTKENFRPDLALHYNRDRAQVVSEHSGAYVLGF